MYLGQIAPAPAAAKPGILDYLGQAVPALVQLYREREATKLQMERAKQGLPALPLEQYSPAIRVEGGLDKRTLLVGLATVAGVVLGAAYLLRGRRRRV